MSGVWGESACGCIGEVRKGGRMNDLGERSRKSAWPESGVRWCARSDAIGFPAELLINAQRTSAVDAPAETAAKPPRWEP
jgi:hypothetical protein